MRAWLHRVACGFAIVLYGVSAHSGGLKDFSDGWLLDPMDQVSRLADMSGAELTSQQQWWLQAGQMRLFGLPSLPVTALGFGYVGPVGGLAVTMTGQWQRTGRDLLLEDLAQVSLYLGDHRRWGVQVRRRTLTLAGQSAMSALDVSLLLRFPVPLGVADRSRLEVSLPLTGAPSWYGSRGRHRLVHLVLLLPHLGLGVDLDHRGDGEPCVTVDLFFGLSSVIGVGVRTDPVTGQLGPTTVWKAGPLLTRTAHLIHPELGLTHRVEILLGRWGRAS